MNGYRLFINVPAAIAIAINVVKVGDLLLPRDKQKQFQRFIDDLALSLSDLNGRRQVEGYLRAHKVVFGGIIVITSCLALWPLNHWAFAPRWAFVPSIALGSLLSASTLIWTIEAVSTSGRMLRASLASGIPLLVLVLLISQRDPVIVQSGSKLPLLAVENIKAYAITASLAATTIPLFGLLLWITTLWICVIFLKVGAKVIWLIALYDRGAWAAVMALLASVLTIAAIFVNGK